MATVTIACRLPNGLTLEVDGVKKTINGYNSVASSLIVGEHNKIGVTEDVDKSFWDKWREIYKDHPICVNQHVYETKSESSAKAQAKELKGVKSGLDQKTTQELDKATGAKKDSDEV